MRLTTPQLNIWNLQKYYTNSSISNVCGTVMFEKDTDIDLLKKAINQVIFEQDGLRLIFKEKRGNVNQEVQDYHALDFKVQQLSEAQVDQYAATLAKTPFTLTNQLLFHFEILITPKHVILLVCLNHLICDAWSLSFALSEVSTIYQMLLKGEDLSIRPHYSYTKYIEAETKYVSSSRYIKDQLYWQDLYTHKVENSYIRAEMSPVQKACASRLTRELTPALTRKINQFAEKNNLSPAILFEAAIFTYLTKINNENNNITIGIPVLNRATITEKKTIGMFISTIPFTLTIDKFEKSISLMNRIALTHSTLFRHQKYPFSQILEYIREKHHYEGNLYDVMVSYQNATTNIENVKTKWYGNGYSEIPLAFHIDNRDSNDSFTLNIDYQNEIFSDEKEVNYLIDRILFVIRQLIANKTIENISILPDLEYNQVVYDFNRTKVEYPLNKCIHELFEEEVRKHPDDLALVYEDQSFTYATLDALSNSLAHYLRDKLSVKANQIVPIISVRSYHIIIAILGILKAGAAYMPIDPAYPEDCIEYMLETASSTFALSYRYHGDLPYPLIDLESFDYSYNPSKVENISQVDDLAYIIFTSGSTGRPKGVSITHKNVVNYVHNNNLNVCFKAINKEKSIVSVTNYVFDIFVTESILPLLNHITIYLGNDEQAISQKKLSKLIEQHPIEIIQTTPTKMKSYLFDHSNLAYLKKLKVIILGGECLNSELYNELRKYTEARIYNIYGPAETTVWSTIKEMKDQLITIGKPIANTQVYILDSNIQPLPIGVPGELCISGDGVGNGYLNRANLTREHFILDPFIKGSVMYRTGDLGRMLCNGEIEYLGRIDSQIKIRGLRVELGEIENVMSSFPGIKLTAVSDKKDPNNRHYLVGYYLADHLIDENELRNYLTDKLPRYMVPNYFMKLEQMPMTTSGKIARKELPVPVFNTNKNTYIEPVTPTQKKLCEIFVNLFKVDHVGNNDDFFNLGGDSLLAIRLLSIIEESFQVEISIKDISNLPRIEDLANYIDQKETRAFRLEHSSMQEYPLLPQQLAIYSYCKKDPSSLSYNMPSFIELPSTIDLRKLKESFIKLFKIFPELHTVIENKEGIINASFKEHKEVIFENYSDENYMDFVRPFDLEKGPLVRLAFTPTKLLLDIHHIICDGMSLHLLLNDLALIYQDNTIDQKYNYVDYASYYRNYDFTKHKEYFRNYIHFDVEPLGLPERKEAAASIGKTISYRIPSSLTEKIKAFASKNQYTETMLYLAAYGILLDKFTYSETITTNIILQNRDHQEFRKTIGMFVNTMPFIFSDTNDLTQYMQSVKENLLDLYYYQELSFLKVVEKTHRSDLNRINTLFVYQAYNNTSITFDQDTMEIKRIDTHTHKFDLSFEIIPGMKDYTLNIEFDANKYEDELIERLYKGYIRILDSIDKTKKDEIEVISNEEKEILLHQFNNTEVDYDHTKLISYVIHENALKHPDTTALIFHDHKYSYLELERRANIAANKLLLLGIHKKDVVGILLPRSEWVIILQIAILKCGAVFLPIDNRYPQDRIDYMIKDCDIRLLISDSMSKSAKVNTILVDELDKDPDDHFIQIPIDWNDYAYIIYTSGSTGKSKGCVLTAGGITNFCINNKLGSYAKNLDRRISVSVNTISFDFFIAESLLPLSHLWTIVLADEDQSNFKDSFKELVEKYHANIVQSTPTRLGIYSEKEEKDSYFNQFELIVSAGEELKPSFLAHLRTITDAKVYNTLGPSECSIWVVDGDFEGDDITIGRPIANTRIYILDRFQHLVPLGVPGELCIAGQGVGAGYLNQPDLTCERFIPDPFYKGIIYRTGDLTRWRRDGSIDYLGRIDSQVKIRGLRVELGEIESVMADYKGILRVAAAIKKDQDDHAYLVGYYVADQSIDHSLLKAYLSKKLPSYMVPNYYMALDHLPMTGSGKTARNALPVPLFTRIQANSFVAPVTKTEKKLCYVLENLFNLPQIGIEDNFFELGGDSLKAIEYSTNAHVEGIEIPMQMIFNYPTIKELAKALNTSKQKITYHIEDFKKYDKLLSCNQNASKLKITQRELGNVLLTGATGFLGIHILDALLKEKVNKVYCLVRNKEKFEKLLDYYFDTKYKNNSHISIILGDLTENITDHLPEDIQTIIHCAASVKHYGRYEELERINVGGTKQMISYAKKHHAKLVHISTISVSGNSFADSFDQEEVLEEMDFKERDLYISQPLDNVYARSKFEAERAVLDYLLEGYEGCIIRMGNLTNRYQDYKFQPNYQSNAFLTRIKAGLEFGIVPNYLTTFYAEFSPIDYSALGVVTIAKYNSQANVFHLNSDQIVYFDSLVDYVKKMGISIIVTDGTTFSQLLEKAAKTNRMNYIYHAFSNDLDENNRLLYDSKIHILNTFTIDYLARLGFKWPKIDEKYIEGYINYFRKIGYLEV